MIVLHICSHLTTCAGGLPILNKSLKLWWVFQFYVTSDMTLHLTPHLNTVIHPLNLHEKKQSQYVNLFSWLLGITCKNTP